MTTNLKRTIYDDSLPMLGEDEPKVQYFLDRVRKISEKYARDCFGQVVVCTQIFMNVEAQIMLYNEILATGDADDAVNLYNAAIRNKTVVSTKGTFNIRGVLVKVLLGFIYESELRSPNNNSLTRNLCYDVCHELCCGFDIVA